jgi:hypothetical protein
VAGSTSTSWGRDWLSPMSTNVGGRHVLADGLWREVRGFALGPVYQRGRGERPKS